MISDEEQKTARRLRKMRQLLGLSQNEAARMARLSYTMINLYENCHLCLNQDQTRRLEQALLGEFHVRQNQFAELAVPVDG